MQRFTYSKINANIWLLGPNLLETCIQPSMVTSPTGNGVVILGCEGHPEDIYELVNTGGALHLEKMSQKLSYPRSHTISMLLPDNLVNCDIPWFYW